MLKLWTELRPRLLLAAALAVSGVAFWWLGALLNFPEFRGYDVSVLRQPLAAAKLLAIAVAVVGLTVLCTFICGRVRYDAGWGCVAAGLYALRLRGGPIYPTINDQPATVFLQLMIELVLLTMILGGVWAGIHILRERGSSARSLRRVLELPDPRTRIADRKATAESLDQKLLALVLCAGSMALFMTLLCRSPERAQVLFSLAISSYLAVWITHAFIPTRPGVWFWSGPVLCGLAGYFFAWMGTTPAQLAVGETGGYFAALARPLPLDYVSVGVPIALWRYVTSRTHQTRQIVEAQRQEAMTTPEAPVTA